ncbi:NAD(P)/FAD-dependent oxidoreductase [Silvimonas amylolytica]|uniref:FAD-dependent oxidoreductase n=1 Tax=Silvimonas amylolytica TaxID=449663 RepID=A0ABQ2PMZ5_9NEIS|nr:FAD-dependent monooxygenase [Silvimonas amylolytica]GGP26740.1 FAD-dependent oxidoreductase [Silvimonas amylolytica]
MQTTQHAEVVIIGAGPAGAIAAALLRKQGRQVLVLERETFPRFSIGESLLPQSMAYIEEAGLLQDVVEAGFQYKNGAVFARGLEATTFFDFRDKWSKGWGTTYQVQRGTFDKVLADGAAHAGAEIRYQQTVLAADVESDTPSLRVKDNASGDEYTVNCRFVLDASGFGRVLPRLLDLETPSGFPVRGAIFTHVEDRIPVNSGFDRNKILITTHPEHEDVWYWTIPFSNGHCSLGVVAESSFLARYEGADMARLQAVVAEAPNLKTLLADAQWHIPARQITGYAANVKSLYGKHFALLGNAGEFLDPVFSSGVTIAMTSASLAAKALGRTLDGEAVDWNADYAVPLKRGVDAFRAFVTAWYDGRFQKLIYYKGKNDDIRRMISSILAGYAWDETNPCVRAPTRWLAALDSAVSM